MLLRNIEDARALLGSLPGTLVGVGVTAFGRVVPSRLVDGYRAVVLRRTADLPILRRCMEVFCLEEEAGSLGGLDGLNSYSLLAHPRTRSYLKGLPDPKILFLYQSYPELEELAREEGWLLIGNRASLRLRLSSRAFFDNLVLEEGLPGLRGGIYPFSGLVQQGYGHWANYLGEKFVLQLPEVRQGGGRGTFFIRSEADYGKVTESLHDGTWRGATLETISLHEYREGVSVSLVACVTRSGVLVSGLQRQMVDLPLPGSAWENGIFCGHSWGEIEWAPDLQAEAERQAVLIGRRFGREGYRGILGIDFLLDRETGRLYPLEVNPRLTGALPMLSLMHLSRGVVPLEVPHLLEFLGIPYEVEEGLARERYLEPLKGGHLLLFRGSEEEGFRERPLRAGLYERDVRSAGFRWEKEAMEFGGAAPHRQFIVIDGPPVGETAPAGSEDPLFRLCRILFPVPPVGPDGSLIREAQAAARWVRAGILR